MTFSCAFLVVKEKEDLHPDPEIQSGKDETFGDYRYPRRSPALARVTGPEGHAAGAPRGPGHLGAAGGVL